METLRFILDGSDRGQPDNWKEFGATIQFQKDSGGVFASFDNDLTFSGNGFAYINSKRSNGVFCDRISVTVVDSCNSDERVLTKGYILLTDCEFDHDKCTVKTKLLDDGFQTRINNNKSIQFYSNTPTTKNGETITEPYTSLTNQQRAKLFVPSTGNYVFPDKFAYGWSAWWAFSMAVQFMSDGTVGFASDYFLTGGGKETFITSGKAIRNGDASPFLYSFADIYNAFTRKRRLGFGFERDSTGRPVLRIEPRSYFENNPSVVQLNDIPGLITSYDKESIYANIALGSKEFLEEWQGNNSEATLSFPQVRFRGFKEEQFGLCGDCNVDATLQLTTQRVVFDTNIIEDILIYQNQNYDETPVVIEWAFYVGDDAATVVSIAAMATDIFGIGTFQYNPSFTNEQQATDQIAGVPCSIYDYYLGYDPADTPFQGASLVPDYSVEISDTPQYQYYSALFGFYMNFATEVFDVGGNYLPTSPTGSRYVAPAAGVYSFFTRIKKEIGPSTGAAIRQRIMFVRFNSAGDVIKTHYQTPQIVAEALSACAEANDTFFMNEGDYVQVDMEFEVLFATSAVYDFATGNVYGGECDDENVIFSGSGQPIQGGELEPADPNQFNVEISKFRYPLTRNQVRSLINNTTAGIGFTRELDLASIQDGNLSRISIPSIHRGFADFELKTPAT